MYISQALFLSRSVAALEASGITVTETSDFDRVSETIEAIGKPYITPILDHAKSDLSHSNCFWITASRYGNPVAACGVRFDDMGLEPADVYWGRQFRRHYEGGIHSVAPPLVDIIKGKTCYIGDLYLSEAGRGGLQILNHAARIAHTLCHLKWSPDVTYSFLRKKDADRGAAARYGYASVIPNSKVFANATPPRTNDEVCATLTKSEYNHWVKSEVRD